MVEVRAEVLDVFDADRKPQEAVGEAHRQPNLAWDRGVSHGSRVADEAFDPAQAFGAGEEPEPVEHPPARFKAPIAGTKEIIPPNPEAWRRASSC